MKGAVAWKNAVKGERTLPDAGFRNTEVLVTESSTAVVLVDSVMMFVSVELALWGLGPSLKEDSLEKGLGGL